MTRENELTREQIEQLRRRHGHNDGINTLCDMALKAAALSERVWVPMEIDRAKHRHVLEVWNQCMADCETLEMVWPKLVEAISE